MGAWSWPFSSRKNALKFKKRMSQPWIAKVQKDSEANMYTWQAADISFGDGIYGEDQFWDELSRVAERRKKSFDIRPYLIKNLKKEMRFLKRHVGIEFHIEDFNLVGQAIGVPSLLEKDFSVVQRGIISVMDSLRERGASVDRLHEIDMKDKTHVRLLRVSAKIIKMFSAKKHVCLRLVVTSQKNLEGAFENIPQVLAIDIKKRKPSEFLCVILLSLKKQKEVSRYHLVYKKDSSNKFWIGEVKKNQLITMYGRTGAHPRKTVKSFADQGRALKVLRNMVQEKLKKGYNLKAP